MIDIPTHWLRRRIAFARMTFEPPKPHWVIRFLEALADY